MTVALDTVVREVRGDDALRAVVIEHRRTGEHRVLNACSLFVFIGAKPCTAWLTGALALDDRGFVLTGAEAEARAAAGVREGQGRRCLRLETSLPGVFATGDVRSGSVKRVTSAAGEGAMAVHHVHDHLGHTAADLTRPSADPTPIRSPSASTSTSTSTPYDRR